MSTLRRSNSASHIPRLSRNVIRQSSAVRVRSSSNRPSSVTSNLLGVPGLGTFGRSSSYTNLATPSQRITGGTTPTSSAYKLNNKDWQKTQFQKVKHFFAQIDPNMPTLKPLSIKAYIYSMDILFKQLDSRISITQNDFKDSVPEYLKSFKYPHQLKPSVVKSPAVPSSWQYILQIWLWLIDLIEVVQSSVNAFIPQTPDEPAIQLFDAAISHMSDRFTSYNSNEDEEIQMEKNKTIDKKFICTLAEIYNVGDVDAEDKEEVYLDNQLEIAKKAYAKNLAYKEELVKKIERLRMKNQKACQQKYDRRNELLAKIKKLTIASKNNEIALKECNEKKAQLKNIISSQSGTKSDMKESQAKVDELSHRLQLLKQRRQKQMELIENRDSKLIQERKKLESMIFEINNKTAFSGCKVQLQELKISEHDLDSTDLPKNLQRFSEKIKEIRHELIEELEKVKATLSEKKKEKKKGDLKINRLDCELKKLCEIEEKYSKMKSAQIDMYQKQIEKAHLEVIKKKKELEEMTSKRPDIEKMKRELQMSVEGVEKLESLQKETIAKSQELFIHTTDIIKQTQTRLKEIMNDIITENTSEIEEQLEKIRQMF